MPQMGLLEELPIEDMLLSKLPEFVNLILRLFLKMPGKGTHCWVTRGWRWVEMILCRVTKSFFQTACGLCYPAKGLGSPAKCSCYLAAS